MIDTDKMKGLYQKSIMKGHDFTLVSIALKCAYVFIIQIHTFEFYNLSLFKNNYHKKINLQRKKK